MTNEKKLPQIIASVMLLVFFVLGLAACSSVPKGPFVIQPQPLATGTLQGKKVVIYDIGMVERGGASRQEGNRSGGLIGAFQVGAGIASVLSYNNSAKNFDKTNEENVKEMLGIFGAIIASAWQRMYNAEAVQAVYDFGTSNPKLDYFLRANAAVKSEIVNTIAQNNAEYAVTIMQQITHGYLVEGAIGIGNTALTHISAQIVVFNKNGDIVVSATAKLPDVLAGMTSGYRLTANNASDYEQLYLNGLGNIGAAIMSIDESAAYFTFEELLVDIIIRLITTEDVE